MSRFKAVTWAHYDTFPDGEHRSFPLHGSGVVAATTKAARERSFERAQATHPRLRELFKDLRIEVEEIADAVVLHKRLGRKYDLSGQRYWTEVSGVRFEIKTWRSRPRNPAIWMAWQTDSDGNSIPASNIVAHGRVELEQKLAAAVAALRSVVAALHEVPQ